MTPAVRWIILAYLLTGLMCGCRHTYQRDRQLHDLEASNERWAETAAKHEEQQQQTEQQQQRRSSGKARIVRPQETIDVEWVDDVVTRYLATVQAASDSKSHTEGSADRLKKHDASDKQKGSTSWWPPLWMWIAGAAVVVAVLWLLRWRARRLRLV